MPAAFLAIFGRVLLAMARFLPVLARLALSGTRTVVRAGHRGRDRGGFGDLVGDGGGRSSGGIVVMGVDMDIRVHGADKLARDFARCGPDLRKELRKAIQEAAEPVRSEAEFRAGSGISNMGMRVGGIPWSTMRVGVTARSVYIAPRKRATRNQNLRRPNLAGLLMGVAMEPALASQEQEAMRRIEQAVDRTMKRHNL